jgi:hypothetical protein
VLTELEALGPVELVGGPDHAEVAGGVVAAQDEALGVLGGPDDGADDRVGGVSDLVLEPASGPGR